MKEILALDIDDTSLGYGEQFIEYVNEIMGLNISRESFISYDLDISFGCTHQQARDLVNNFNNLYLERIEPIEGAVEGIKTLKDKYNLVNVTSRPADLDDRTRNYMERRFPGCFSATYLVKKEAPGLSKGEFCQRIGARILVDDFIGNLEDCGRLGISAYLFGNWPFSRFEHDSDLREKYHFIQRARDWSELVEKLMA